jgi:hypothetical protein
MEGMANTCRLLGGDPSQAALYRSANPSYDPVAAQMHLSNAAMFFQPPPAPVPQFAPTVRCQTWNHGGMLSTTCQ